MGKIALEFPFSIERPIGDLEGFGFGFQFVQTDGELLSFFSQQIHSWFVQTIHLKH